MKMTITQLANRYNISTATMRDWPKYAGFPKNALKREGAIVFWDVEKTDAWLRSRPITNRRTPRWVHVVNHPDAELVSPKGNSVG